MTPISDDFSEMIFAGVVLVLLIVFLFFGLPALLAVLLAVA